MGPLSPSLGGRGRKASARQQTTPVCLWLQNQEQPLRDAHPTRADDRGPEWQLRPSSPRRFRGLSTRAPGRAIVVYTCFFPKNIYLLKLTTSTEISNQGVIARAP